MTAGTDLTILVALAAGLISFLSPCVLPLVPAYLGQLSAIAVAGAETPRPDRWLAIRHAIAFVVGFTAVFTLLGITATYLAQGLVDILPAAPRRRWRDPHRPGAEPGRASCASPPSNGRGDRSMRAPPAASPRRRARSRCRPAGRMHARRFGDRLGGRLVGSSGGLLASLGLGSIFAIGWTPCIGIILGGILTMAATSGTVAQGTLLLVALLPRPRAAVPGRSRSPTTARRRSSGRSSATAGRSR